jgi:hypothetical protein
MPPKLQEPRRAEPREPEGGPLEAAVRGSVMSELGRPPGLHRVQVRRVWGDRYRVNVFVGDGAASVKVAHSFFLQAGGDGRALESSPPIARLYSYHPPNGEVMPLRPGGI